jgi:hypothetical protein
MTLEQPGHLRSAKNCSWVRAKWMTDQVGRRAPRLARRHRVRAARLARGPTGEVSGHDVDGGAFAA